MTSKSTLTPSTIAFVGSAAQQCRPHRQEEKVLGLNLILNYSQNGWRTATNRKRDIACPMGGAGDIDSLGQISGVNDF